MYFSMNTVQLGGMITVPDSFVNKKDAGEITHITHAGINVVYNKGLSSQQKVFYGFPWLNQMYGSDVTVYNESGLPVEDNLNDVIPF